MARSFRFGGIKNTRAQANPMRGVIRAILSDGQPHPWSEISRAATPMVTPEVALARYNRLNPNTERPMFYRIEMGRQAYVLQSIRRVGAVVVVGDPRRPSTCTYRLPGVGSPPSEEETG